MVGCCASDPQELVWSVRLVSLLLSLGTYLDVFAPTVFDTFGCFGAIRNSVSHLPPRQAAKSTKRLFVFLGFLGEWSDESSFAHFAGPLNVSGTATWCLLAILLGLSPCQTYNCSSNSICSIVLNPIDDGSSIVNPTCTLRTMVCSGP